MLSAKKNPNKPKLESLYEDLRILQFQVLHGLITVFTVCPQ